MRIGRIPGKFSPVINDAYLPDDENIHLSMQNENFRPDKYARMLTQIENLGRPRKYPCPPPGSEYSAFLEWAADGGLIGDAETDLALEMWMRR